MSDNRITAEILVAELAATIREFKDAAKRQDLAAREDAFRRMRALADLAAVMPRDGLEDALLRMELAINELNLLTDDALPPLHLGGAYQMTKDPRLLCADAHGRTHVGVDLSRYSEGWRGAGCYVVVHTSTPNFVRAGWVDPLTKSGKPRRNFTVSGMQFPGEGLGKYLHVYRVDEWSPPV